MNEPKITEKKGYNYIYNITNKKIIYNLKFKKYIFKHYKNAFFVIFFYKF